MATQKEIIERLYPERSNFLTALEEELAKKKENLLRWEDEVKRLETALDSKESRNHSLKSEFERARE